MSGLVHNIADYNVEVDVKNINQKFSKSSSRQRLKPRLSRSLTPPRLVQLRTSTPPSRVKSSISGEGRHVSRGASRKCCQNRRHLEKENIDLIHQLRQEQDYQRNLESIWKMKLEDVKNAHKDNLVQLGTIVATQKQIGEQWRQEMTELTLKYQTKLKHEQNKNKKLRAHLKYLQNELNSKEAEAQEYSELTLFYSSKINKLEKQLKEEKNKDGESYIEVTFPFTPL